MAKECTDQIQGEGDDFEKRVDKRVAEEVAKHLKRLRDGEAKTDDEVKPEQVSSKKVKEADSGFRFFDKRRD